MNLLRLFHFKNEYGKTRYVAGKIYVSKKTQDYSILPEEIILFFEKHAAKVIDSSRTQNVRFKNKNVIFLDYLNSLFDSIDNFDKGSVHLAEKFSTSLKNPPKKDFYLIFFDTVINSDSCFAILTMEARQGVQVNNDSFDLVEEILPDMRARLNKAAIIYRDRSQTFMEDSEPVVKVDGMPIRHAVLIDSQTNASNSAISEYFIANFLDCENIADNPNAVAKIITDTIPKVVFPYLKDRYTKKNVKDALRTKFSSKQRSDFKDIINSLKPLLSDDKIKKNHLDYESLSELAYEAAKKENKTITKTFEAQVIRVPKTVLQDKKGGKSIYFSVSNQSLDSKDVIFNTKDEDFFVFKVKKDLVKLIEKN